jgi:hypothetical protein
LTLEGCSNFTETIDVGIFRKLGGEFKILIFEDKRHVCGIKDSNLIRFTNDLETEGSSSILEIIVSMTLGDMRRDLGSFKT